MKNITILICVLSVLSSASTGISDCHSLSTQVPEVARYTVGGLVVLPINYECNTEASQPHLECTGCNEYIHLNDGLIILDTEAADLNVEHQITIRAFYGDQQIDEQIYRYLFEPASYDCCSNCTCTFDVARNGESIQQLHGSKQAGDYTHDNTSITVRQETASEFEIQVCDIRYCREIQMKLGIKRELQSTCVQQNTTTISYRALLTPQNTFFAIPAKFSLGCSCNYNVGLTLSQNGVRDELDQSLTYDMKQGLLNLFVMQNQNGNYSVNLLLTASDCPQVYSRITVLINIQCQNLNSPIVLTPINVQDNFRFIYNQYAFRQFAYSHYQCAKPVIAVSVRNVLASNWQCQVVQNLLQCTLLLDKTAESVIGNNTVDLTFYSPVLQALSFKVNIVDPCNDGDLTSGYFYLKKTSPTFTFRNSPQTIVLAVQDLISGMFGKPQYCGQILMYQMSEKNNVDTRNLVRKVTVYNNYTVNIEMYSSNPMQFAGVDSITLQLRFQVYAYTSSFFFFPVTIELIDTCWHTQYLSQSPDILKAAIYSYTDSLSFTFDPLWNSVALNANQQDYCGNYTVKFISSSSSSGSVDSLVNQIGNYSFQFANYKPSAPITGEDYIYLNFEATLNYYGMYKATAYLVQLKVYDACLNTQLWPYTTTPKITQAHETIIGFAIGDAINLRAKYFLDQNYANISISGPRHNYLWSPIQQIADMNLVTTLEVKRTYYYQSDIISEFLNATNASSSCNRPTYQLYVEGVAGNNDFIKLSAPEDASNFTLTLFSRNILLIGNYSCEVRATIRNGNSQIVTTFPFKANIFANFTKFVTTEVQLPCKDQPNSNPYFVNTTSYIIGSDNLYYYYNSTNKRYLNVVKPYAASEFQLLLPTVQNWACFQDSFAYEVTLPAPQGSTSTKQIPGYPEIKTERYMSLNCTEQSNQCQSQPTLLTLWIPPTYQNKILKVLVTMNWRTSAGPQHKHYTLQINATANKYYPQTNTDWTFAYKRFKLAHGDYVSGNVQKPNPFVPSIWNSLIADGSAPAVSLETIRQTPINLSKANPNFNYADLAVGDRAKWLLDDGSVVLSAGCLPELQEVTNKGKVTISFSRNLNQFDAMSMFDSNVVQILLIPGDSQAETSLFNYTRQFNITQSESSFTISLLFDQPTNVGYNLDAPDTLLIVFVRAEQFITCSKDKYQSTYSVAPNFNRRLELGPPLNDQIALDQIPQGFSISVTLPPQIFPNQTESTTNLENVGTATTTSLFSTLAICFVFNLSMQLLLGSINALQMISHLPMINLNFSADYILLNGFIQQVVGFDLFNIFAYFPNVFAFSEVEPWYPWFANDQTAYGDVNFFNNVGSIALFLMIFVLRLLINPLFGLLNKLGVRGHNYLTSMYVGRLKIVNMTMTILSEVYIEILVGGIMNFAMLTQVPLEIRNGMDQWSIDFGFVCFIPAVILPFLVTWYTLYHSRWLTNINLDEERLAFYTSNDGVPFQEAQQQFQEQFNMRLKKKSSPANLELADQPENTAETQRQLNSGSKLDFGRHASNKSMSPRSNQHKQKFKFMYRKSFSQIEKNQTSEGASPDQKDETLRINIVAEVDQDAADQFYQTRMSQQYKMKIAKQFGHKIRENFNYDTELGWQSYIMECEDAQIRLNENIQQKYQVEQKLKSYMAWEVFKEGIKPTSHLANLNRFLFIWRRVIFVLMTLFLEEPAIQLIIFMCMSFFMIAYLMTVMPYETDFQNNIEIFNEIIVFLLSAHCVILVAFKTDETQLGISMITFVIIMLAVNGYFVIKDLIMQIYEKAHQDYIRRQQLRKMRQRKIKVAKYKATAAADNIDAPEIQHENSGSLETRTQLNESNAIHLNQIEIDSDFSNAAFHQEIIDSIQVGHTPAINSSQLVVNTNHSKNGQLLVSSFNRNKTQYHNQDFHSDESPKKKFLNQESEVSCGFD